MAAAPTATPAAAAATEEMFGVYPITNCPHLAKALAHKLEFTRARSLCVSI